ncbi:protein TE1 [Testudinid alphaherpesvirus 3]|uniref:Protein TE1 n=1 Tax=Testudinid alphaherpesvirus 3 TaxID=2560801 RepID=A0A0K1R217_9ALPH|nr:protein TE1 [Testudinid alphaherpesvirus 3]YP_009176867.1 protein TE1 [Testudinid alphaherpesvirus 3]AIU39322.1 protein TE1 [Testudinid alphaherpesvirus 3]AIU39332.1 protein TE1 [Testudinid alphaherpesvirus 3]AIU39427.1 protein TE1 [Testudinid alphaherpesvirus 3]AKI81702.1 protein TE1 [Testudinid alphaherpesvirus 3]AKI81803.1 protein TE1 [Testudinid alphaherpesvirus 3]
MSEERWRSAQTERGLRILLLALPLEFRTDLIRRLWTRVLELPVPFEDWLPAPADDPHRSERRVVSHLLWHFDVDRAVSELADLLPPALRSVCLPADPPDMSSPEVRRRVETEALLYATFQRVPPYIFPQVTLELAARLRGRGPPDELTSARRSELPVRLLARCTPAECYVVTLRALDSVGDACSSAARYLVSRPQVWAVGHHDRTRS